MIDQHGKVRRASGQLVRVLTEIAACGLCRPDDCHAPDTAASARRLRDALQGSPTELRRAAATLLWHLQNVEASCTTCWPDEGCHQKPLTAAMTTLQAELHPKKGGAR